jgi:cytochrome P450
MMLAAANRDESTFHDPDTIAPERPNASEHLAFGGGLHHCLGAPVARIQLQETLKALTETFTGLELGGADYTRHPSLVFPSLVSLPLVASSR